MCIGRPRCLPFLLLLFLILLLLMVNSSGKSNAEGCTSGFVSLESLIAQSGMFSFIETGQYLYPSFKFTCNGSITGWSVLIRRSTDNNNTLYPDLQVWRGEGGGVYTRVGNTTLSGGIITSGGKTGFNIREYPLEPPLEFQTGDIFGIFQPPLDMSYLYVSAHKRLGSTPTVILIETNSAVKPPNGTLNLNNVDSSDSLFAYVHVSVMTDQPQCVNGFVTNEMLQSVYLQRRFGLHSIPKSTQIVSPHNSFTCDGNVTKWIMRWQQISFMTSSFPELQVWRPSNEANATFQLVGRTAITADPGATRDIADNVFEFTVNPPLPVQAGDVLGIYQPAESRIKLFYEPEGSNKALFQSGVNNLSIFPNSPLTVESIMRAPLISAEVVATSRTLTITTSAVAASRSLTTINSVISLTTTMFPRSTDASFPVAAVAAGIGGGALVALAVLIVLIIVAVVVCRKKKRKTMSSNGSTYVHDNKKYPESDREVEGNGNTYVLDNDKYPDSDSGEHHFNNPVYGALNDIALNETTFDNEVVATVEYAKIDRSRRDQSRSGQTYGKGEIEQHSQYQSITDPVYGNSEDNWDTQVGAHPSADFMLVPTPLQRQGSHVHLPAEEAVIYSRVLKEVHRTPLKFFEEEEIYWEPALDSSQLYSQLASHKYREIPRSQIRRTDKIGGGQFGTVYRGEWKSSLETCEVALKVLSKNQPTGDDRVKFLQEAAIMGQFRHPNVVKLFGVVTVGEPSMIVVELMERGDLKEYLHQLRPTPGEMVAQDLITDCLKFTREICSGMTYLSGKAFIHRDLAARNVLVSQYKVCKIADFGMARGMEDSDYYRSQGGEVPIKWTAPESIHYKKYSIASDVWSFGVTLYEIWSLGHSPFENDSNSEAFRKVSQGARLPPPPRCPRAVYQLMINCWHPEPQSRPSFSDVTAFLSQPESALLVWSEEDRAVYPNAATLGAELQEGHTLYTDLQNTYILEC